MIQSGRTKRMSEELVKWYNQEYSIYESSDWLWGYNEDALKKLLDTREVVPYKAFFVRYLLGVHEAEIEEMAAEYEINVEDELLVEKLAEILIQESKLKKVPNYRNTSNNVKKLVDMVFDDFVDNGMKADTESETVLGSVLGSKDVQWDKTHLLSKIMADKISDNDLWVIAFGLNMDYEDVSFFLKKVLKRSDYNLWNESEFLIFLTLRYAPTNRYEFLKALEVAYLDVKPKENDWIQTEGFATLFVQDKMDTLMSRLKKKNILFIVDDNGKYPKEVLDFLACYKYMNEHSEEYVRTISREAKTRLDKIEQYVNQEIEAQKETNKADEEVVNVAKGYVTLYYSPKKGLSVPKGTRFFKNDKRTGGEIAFRTVEDVTIEPVQNYVKSVEIDVICTEHGRKKAKEEDNVGYMPGKISFRCCNCKGFSKLVNKSMWKAPKEVAIGEDIAIKGKIYAECCLDKLIEETLFFEPTSEGVTKYSYKTVDDFKIDGRATVDILLECEKAGEEALKNEIIDCDIKNWEKMFSRITNKKIGVNKKQKKDKVTGGRLFKYLYSTVENGAYTVDTVLGKGYLDKLERILDGTRLTPTKISHIRNNKEPQSLTRDDILTLAFLEYAIKYERLDSLELRTKKEFAAKRIGFMQQTNKLLKKCGYYELYAPNPYDSLLVLLLSSNESLNAYRNLMSLYNASNEKGEE